jgi:hypothetical protein
MKINKPLFSQFWRFYGNFIKSCGIATDFGKIWWLGDEVWIMIGSDIGFWVYVDSYTKFQSFVDSTWHPLYEKWGWLWEFLKKLDEKTSNRVKWKKFFVIPEIL